MSNEITLKVNCNATEFENILKNKQFVLSKRFDLDDTYFVLDNIDIKQLSARDILKNCIIIRDITDYYPKTYNTLKLTYKEKKIDNETGEIINQENINCKITSKEDGIKFLNAIHYRKLINIKEHDIVYEKNGLEIAIKDIETSNTLIEVEIKEDARYNTIEKLKQKIDELELPIDKSNYFVKKAEIELEKIL